MNKKGIGLGPAIIVSIIILALFLMGTEAMLSYGKTSVIKKAEVDADTFEVRELLLDLLDTNDGNLNVADFISLRKFDKAEELVKRKLPESYSFRIYEDFKSVIQSKPIYALEKEGEGKEITAMKDITDYFGNKLSVYLMVRK